MLITTVLFFPADVFDLDGMYYQVKRGNQMVWMGVRGTSKLEGFHGHMNQLLQGNRTSPALAGKFNLI